MHVSLAQTPTPPSGKPLRVSTMPYISSHHITHRSYIVYWTVSTLRFQRIMVTSITQSKWRWNRISDKREISWISRRFGTIQAIHGYCVPLRRKFKLTSRFDVLWLVLGNKKNNNFIPSRTAQNGSIITTSFYHYLPFLSTSTTQNHRFGSYINV